VLRATLTHEQLVLWGWRIPFLAGISVTYFAYCLKSHGGDTPGHDLHHSERSKDINHIRADSDPDEIVVHSAALVKNPLYDAFSRSNLRSLIAATLVPMVWSSGCYFSFVWMVIYMSKLIDDPVAGAHAINAVSLFGSVCVVFPLAGALSDRLGRVRVMTWGACGMGLLSPILIQVIRRGNPWLALLSQCTLGVSLSLYGAPMCAWLVEAFEPGARLTSVAIGYNFAQAIAGGSTPFIATTLVDIVGPGSPGWILTFLSVTSLIGLRCVAPSNARHKALIDSLSQSERKEADFEMVDTVTVSLHNAETERDGSASELL
jgi:MFS transporter, MHS family, proline/betaine transporter